MKKWNFVGLQIDQESDNSTNRNKVSQIRSSNVLIKVDPKRGDFNGISLTLLLQIRSPRLKQVLRLKSAWTPLPGLRWFQKTYEKSDFSLCLCCARHTAQLCHFLCCENVSHRKVCPDKVNMIFLHKNDYFSPSPSEYLVPALPVELLHGK